MSSEAEAQPYPFGAAEKLDLHPRYQELRDTPGMPRVQPPFGGATYLATRYDDVRAVLSDPRLSRAQIVGENEPRVHPFITAPDALSALDPPEHTRLRRVLMGAFTTRRMEALRPRIQQIVDDTLTEVEKHGPPADLVELVANPVPATVVCELLGVPVADRATFKRWAETILSAGSSSPEEVFAAYQQMTGYLAECIAKRRLELADDLLSALIEAHDMQDRLTDTEMVGLATTVLVAGHETTVNQIASFTYVLLTHPHHLAQLRADETLMPQAVEELLRVAPVMATAGFARVALEEVSVGGVTLQPGEAVMPTMYSANRDPRVFPNPDDLDFHRANAGTHVAFSHGPHHCPGAQLARIEFQIVLGSLLKRFPGLALAVPPEEVPWKAGGLARGPASLPVTW